MPITNPNDFIENFRNMQGDAFRINVKNGFWGETPYDKTQNVGERIALIHSELSEALEAHRKGDIQDDKLPQYTGLEAELADAVIRIMDMAEGFDLRVAEAIVDKIAFNATRPFKHGKDY